MQNLDGKVALVTGAGRGIGRAIALKLASEGPAVVVNDLDEPATEETVATINAAGGTAVDAWAASPIPPSGRGSSATALDTFGGLDIIVNNAGYTWDSVIQKMTDEQFQAIMDVHVTAPFRILRAAAEPIRTIRQGRSGRRPRGVPKGREHLVGVGTRRQRRAR